MYVVLSTSSERLRLSTDFFGQYRPPDIQKPLFLQGFLNIVGLGGIIEWWRRGESNCRTQLPPSDLRTA